MNGFSDKRPRSLVTTYATRLGRLCYLKYYCGPDHPVYITETHLVQMAESKLREQLYVLYGTRSNRHRVTLENKIKSIAKMKISDQIENDVDRNSIFVIIDDIDLGSIFTAH